VKKIVLFKRKLFLGLLLGAGSSCFLDSGDAFSAVDSPISEWDVISKFPPVFINTLPRWVISQQEIDTGNGALGLNRKGYVGVFNQRHASEFIIRGSSNQQSKDIENGIKTIEYAFSYQNPDGSFPDFQPKSTPRGVASSVAFFLQDLGHTLLLSQQSLWFQNSPANQIPRKRLQLIMSKAEISLSWLLQNQSNLYQSDRKAANRLFIDASAFYLMGKALRSTPARQAGLDFLNRALSMQTENGYFLENGGYDSSYNSVSLQIAQQIFSQFAEEPSAMRSRLWSAIDQSMQWQLSRILPSGQVSTIGNTRVYVGGEKYFEKAKRVDYNSLCIALNYYASLSGKPDATRYAQQVFDYRQSQ
jgi:hypothetical protein